VNKLFSDEEIRTIYRDAKDQRLQIKILAELCLTDVNAICDIVGVSRLSSMKKGGRSRLNWNLIEEDIRQGMPDDSIAKKYDAAIRTIKERRISLGLLKQVKNLGKSRIDWPKIIKEIKRGISDEIIAEKYNCSAHSVRAKRLSLGIYKRAPESKSNT